MSLELVLGGLGLTALGVYACQPKSGPLASLPGDVPAADATVVLPASGGPTRYRYAHCGSGHLIVLVPGISYPMELYEPLFNALTNASRAVLMYDVTGRGFSHTSGEPLTVDLCMQQLLELLEALKIPPDTRLSLVGWSMGSCIVTRFAERFSARVEKLVLLGPVGAVVSKKPATAMLLHVPLGIGNALAKLVMPGTLKKLYRAELGDHPIVDYLCDHATRNPSLVRTIVSTLRHFKEIDDNRATLSTVGGDERWRGKILVMWATNDGTVTREGIDATMALMPGAILHVVDGEQHAFFVTKPEACNPHIVDFLR